MEFREVDFKAKIAKGETFYGTGRRKTSIAKITLRFGNADGERSILVNNLPYEEYFQFNPQLVDIAKAPLAFIETENVVYNVKVITYGGGLKSQSLAISLGIARALCSVYWKFRVALKTAGWLTRDARRKERKKYGLKKARKAPQFSKR